MKVVIAQDRGELGRYTADQAAETLRTVLATADECNLVVATGSSQFEVLERLVQVEGVDWSRVNGFHLDEYLGIDPGHSASFCGYLRERFVERVPLKSFYYMNGSLAADELLADACAQLAGRRIDLLLCGIGENAHLAFNDPPADFQTEAPYLIVSLDEACRKQQVGEGWFDSLDDVPLRAISMSVKQILRAKRILCSVPDRRKADAVRATLEESISPDIPATVLREHTNATLVLELTSCTCLSPQTLDDCEHLDAASNAS